MFVVSLQDVVYKVFSSELTLWQTFALRGLLAFSLLIALAWVWGIRGRALLGALEKWTLLRSLLMTMCFLAFYSAIPFLSLSVIGAANYIAPIFVTLLSAYVINESVGIRGWIAVFAGFSGVVILLQPGTDAFAPWAVLPVMGAVFYALSHITT
jgi:drug/metabolite transporter (DMT)-like permease